MFEQKNCNSFCRNVPNKFEIGTKTLQLPLLIKTPCEEKAFILSEYQERTEQEKIFLKAMSE